eukprot:9494053-Pyramimonas_sp.AAC.1
MGAVTDETDFTDGSVHVWRVRPHQQHRSPDWYRRTRIRLSTFLAHRCIAELPLACCAWPVATTVQHA